MSAIYIEVAQVFAKRSLQSEFIVTMKDDYGRDFIETEWKKIPDDDMEILAECCLNFNGDSQGATMIEHMKDFESGIVICGTFYEYDEVKSIIESKVDAD